VIHTPSATASTVVSPAHSPTATRSLPRPRSGDRAGHLVSAAGERRNRRFRRSIPATVGNVSRGVYRRPDPGSERPNRRSESRSARRPSDRGILEDVEP
jgi:hypothetical protein